MRDSLSGIADNVLDSKIVVNKIESQLHYYIHFQSNTLGKGMNPLSLQLWFQ